MGVIETIRFNSLDGVDDARFLAVDQRFETQFLYQQPGFVRRFLTRADDGAWQSFVIWADRDHADRAFDSVGASEVGRERDDLIDEVTVTRECLTGFD